MTQVITHNVTLQNKTIGRTSDAKTSFPNLHFTRDEYLKIDKQTNIKNRQTDEYLKIDTIVILKWST